MPTTTTPALPALRTARVLLIDDDFEHVERLANHLIGDDLDVLRAHSGEAAASRLRTGPVDLVIVRGTLLREVDRLHAAAILPAACPVIALCDGEGEDRTRALRRGAVDAMSLPLHAPELSERAQLALTRRPQAERAQPIKIPGGLCITPSSAEVTVHGQRVALSAKEFELLQLLASDPERVFRKDELLRSIWGYEGGPSTRTLDSHACRVRLKLEEAGGRYITNKWGVGYRLLPLT